MRLIDAPRREIDDAPGCSWRGLMVDLARDFHEFPVLLEYVDLCRFYKIRTPAPAFHGRSKSYTLPSRAFPRLSTPGRSYTEEEIRELVAYAARRDVLLMPEIDVPGHCASFAQGYGDVFGTDGIICQSEQSMACMEALFRELCGMFPNSPYIHIGGDEATISKWTECEKRLPPAARAAWTSMRTLHARGAGTSWLSFCMLPSSAGQPRRSCPAGGLRWSGRASALRSTR